MPLDPSLISNLKEPPDILGKISQYMTLRQLGQQTQMQNQAMADDQAMRDAIKANTTVGEDGTVNINKPATLSQLYKGGLVKQADQMSQQWDQRTKDHQQQIAEGLKLTGQLLGGVKDQPSYDSARAQLIKAGLFDDKHLPQQFDPGFVQNLQVRSLTYQDQMGRRDKDREDQRKARESDASVAKTKAETAKIRSEMQGGPGVKMTEAQSKSLGFGRRAMLADQLVNQVSADPNVDVSSLKTQLKAALPKWMGGIKDQNEQTLATAKASFVASVLRKESGAAVTPDEFAAYDKIYFPQPGDSPQTLRDKQVLRQNFIDTEKLSAGAAWKDPIPFEKRKESPDAAKIRRLQELRAKAAGG